MKVIRFLAVLALIFSLFSCSSDDGSAPAPQPQVSTFQLIWGEQDFGLDTLESNFRAAKMGHIFRFEHGSFSISFDENGHFGYIEMTSNPGHPQSTQYFRSMRAFSSHYVNFELNLVDPVNKRIRGSFSGYVYHDPFNSNSEATFINGMFDMSYSDIIPVIADFGVKAKIGGDDWIYTDWYSSQSSQFFYVSDHYVSDDAYKIMIDYNSDTVVGVYNFTPSDAISKVRLSKYDPVSETYIDYLCSGTLNVTDREGNLYKGSFSFTAVNPQNPNDIIQVTDGQFKTIRTL